MEISIQNQLINISYSLLLGLIFGAGYDIIRIVHIMLYGFRFRHPIVFLLDLVYMLALTAGVSLFSYAINRGVWRLYLLFPMGVGFAVYYHTAGRLVRLFSDMLVRLLRTFFSYAVAKPIRLLLKGLWLVVRWIFRSTVGATVRKIAENKWKRYTERQRKLLKKLVRIGIVPDAIRNSGSIK